MSMTSRPFKGICIILLFFLIFSDPAYANTVCSVVPLDPSQDYNSSTSLTTGATGDVTFWQLPLWVKVSYILSCLAGLIITFKVIIPIFQTRRKRQDATEDVLQFIRDNPGLSISQISRDHGMDSKYYKVSYEEACGRS